MFYGCYFSLLSAYPLPTPSTSVLALHTSGAVGKLPGKNPVGAVPRAAAMVSQGGTRSALAQRHGQACAARKIPSYLFIAFCFPTGAEQRAEIRNPKAFGGQALAFC